MHPALVGDPSGWWHVDKLCCRAPQNVEKLVKKLDNISNNSHKSALIVVGSVMSLLSGIGFMGFVQKENHHLGR